MRHAYRGMVAAFGAMVPALAAPAAATPFFMGLGDLPGSVFQSIAHGVSADGSTVVGWSWSALGAEAFRWTAATGMFGLGLLGFGLALWFTRRPAPRSSPRAWAG